MKFSKLFTKTIKEVPADESSVNAQLLIKGGFISKVMAGVYNYLPLGLRVLNKINNIIRDEMNATGAEELFMSVLQSKETWTTSGRWDTAKEVMYQFKDGSGKEVGLGWTHEEPLTEVAKHFISSYKDLPKAVYQIQTKFRNEPRAKSGLLRGRAFMMKDLYSFHASDADLGAYYEKVKDAYFKIFERCGLKSIYTLAGGGMFTENFTHEFQVLSEVGEDTIMLCSECEYAENVEISKLKEGDVCPKCGGKIVEEKSIEVGNIFKYGPKYSEKLALYFTDEKGAKYPVLSGAYGIGVSRLMATVVETHNDGTGIVWPESIAPYKVHLIVLDDKKEEAEKVCRDLTAKCVEVVYDDRDDKSAGEKFADADLIGCPIRIVISNKTVEKNSVEIKERNKKELKLVKLSAVVEAVGG